jgi:hypothetical protein
MDKERICEILDKVQKVHDAFGIWGVVVMLAAFWAHKKSHWVSGLAAAALGATWWRL